MNHNFFFNKIVIVKHAHYATEQKKHKKIKLIATNLMNKTFTNLTTDFAIDRCRLSQHIS